MKKLLTDRFLDEWMQEGGSGLVWDTKDTGLGIRKGVRQSVWLAFFSHNGKREQVKIGDFNSMTLAEARSTFHEMKANPTKHMGRSGLPTVAEFIPVYWEKHLASKKDQSAKYTMTYIAETIGSKRLDKVTLADVKALHDKASTVSTGIKAQRQLSAMINTAISWGVVPLDTTNPCKYHKLPQLTAKSGHLTNEQVAKMLNVLDTWPNLLAKGAIRLLLLTGCRANEILSLKWSDISGDYMRIGITKNGRPHWIPLTDLIKDTLGELPNLGEWVFPSPRKADTHILSIRTDWDAIKAEVGVTDITLHDLRRTVASMLANTPGITMDQVANALNHKSIETTRRHYAQFTEQNKATVLNVVSDLINKHRQNTSSHKVFSVPLSN